MSPTLESLGIDKLSIEERIALAQEIWESIEADPHPPFLTETQRSEIERRLADHHANPGDVVPWEQIQQEAQARFRQ